MTELRGSSIQNSTTFAKNYLQSELFIARIQNELTAVLLRDLDDMVEIKVDQPISIKISIFSSNSRWFSAKKILPLKCNLSGRIKIGI